MKARKAPRPRYHLPHSRLEPLKVLARRVGLNHALDFVWRHPVRELRQLAQDGGPFERQRTQTGHEAMKRAALTLPAMSTPPKGAESRVHVLTGRKFWHQSVFCIASLQSVMPFRVTPVFYSDGSLDADVAASLIRVLPWSEFVSESAITDRLEEILPTGRYPTLRSRRIEYVHLRKLTDIHVFQGHWKLVADSDLLFFRRPDAIMEWFEKPHLMAMADIVDNYGYPPEYLAALAGGSMPPRFNVGLYGLDSSIIDWDKVEYWCARQLSDFGPSYLQEQGLTAMLAAGQPARMLSDDDFVLMPDIKEGRSPGAVMHHYVNHSKRSYFQHGWRIIDERLRNGGGVSYASDTNRVGAAVEA
jgi:hypothetical protein